MKFELKNEKEAKEEKWRAIEHAVDRTIDRLGKTIDPQIKFAVIALKSNGFGTTQSCEGHAQRGLPYPWVTVESQLAEQLFGDRLYTELGIKNREQKLSASEKELKDKMVQALIAENDKTYQTLKALLVEFYKQEKQTPVRLSIKKGSWNQSRLQPEGVPEGKNWREQVASMNQEEKENNLKLYREEMNRFAQFLKNKFFASK